MESETKQLGTGTCLNENKGVSEVGFESKLENIHESTAKCVKSGESFVSNKSEDVKPKPKVNCEVDLDEDNTQIISVGDYSKEIGSVDVGMDCELQVSDSNLEKEVAAGTQSFETQDFGNNECENVALVNDKTAGIMNETLVIESDEETKDVLNKSDQNVIEEQEADDETNTKEKDERSFGDDSQTTTMDIGEIDDKSPDSPEDLFASQSFENAANQNSPRCGMDSEDFIPSSLASQSEKDENEKESETGNAVVSTIQKRKLEEDEEENDCKVPRLDIPSETSDEMFKPKCSGEELAQVEVSNKSFPEEINSETKISEKKEQTIDEGNKVDLCEETIKDIVDNDLVNKDEKNPKHSPELMIDAETSRDSRKSLEIIFSSYENPVKNTPLSKHEQNLPVVLEENGEQDEEEDSLHLRLSMSPSQFSQSLSECNSSKCKDEIESKTDLSGKNSKSDSTSSQNRLTNSHSDINSNSNCNSHSSKDLKTKLPDAITVDDSDVHVTSPDEKMSNSNDVVVLQSVENNLSPKQEDSDVTVILDKNDDIDKFLNSENSKHREMNGTLLKRKRLDPLEDGEKVIVLDELESTEAVSEPDTRKRSRLGNLSSEGRNTPDLPLLLPNKGKYESTPYDNSKITPASVSISTVDSASMSTGNLRDNEESTLPLRVVKRTYALHVRLHVNDDLRQVHSVEMVQCQSMEDFMTVRAVNHYESSDGSAADESKNSSPSSVMSLGPFSLKSQSYRMSSSSTSTTSSGHSNIGLKSKSEDWHFTAPTMRAPSRSRIRNVQYSPEFERELFELAEKTWYLDETETKLLPLMAKNVASQVSSSSVPSLPEGQQELNKTPQENVEKETLTETPKSSKKLTRGNKNTRSSGRNLVVKIMKEGRQEEQSSQGTPEKETSNAGESTGSQRRTRKPPVRSSKRTTGSTPSTPVVPEESKIVTTPVPSSGRSRRNRNDPTAIEKTDSSSQEHVYDWNAEGCFTKLVAEAPVFARWTDKKYYPGRIKENTKDGRWIVEFDDKTVRPLKEEFIIPVNILIKGQIVFAYDGDEYEQGIIVEFKLKDGEVQYGVDLDSGRKLFVPRSRLFMSEDQARLLRENIDPKSPTTSSPALTTVSCDNIVHHKRPRSTRVLFGNPSPSVSGAKHPSHDTSCSSSVSDINDKGPTFVLDEVGGVDPEVSSSLPELLHTPSGRGKGPGRIKSKSRTPRRNTPSHHSVADAQEFNKLHEILGPIPEKGSKIFSGKCFLLTHSVIRPHDISKMTTSKSTKKGELSSCSEYEDVSTDDGINSNIPFVKDHLKQQLEAGGGIIFENFEDVPEDQYQNCYLVSDRPSLTAKYILCLASGIKIIHHAWVIEEVKGSSRPLASARLQAGWDLEGRCYVPPEATVRTRKQKPLNKKEVGIVNESSTFVKFWERILELLGANVRLISPGSPEQDRQFSGVDVILTDSTCPPEVQDRAREWSIPLVSTVWVTQTLINWRIRPYSGHPHYRYDYCTSD